MNLAPFKYRNILFKDGGPLERISVREIKKNGFLFFEAYAYLINSEKACLHFSIYGNADGTGTSEYKNIACYKAISEALERWAFYKSVNSNERELYGFHINPTTTGIAAFPGLTHKTARKNAFYEALERWALCEWWSGNLGHSDISKDSFHAVEITTPLPKTSTVVIWCLQNDLKFYAYGFACHKNLKEAISKAQIELNRNLYVLEKFYKKKLNLEIFLNSENSTLEKRLLFFSSKDGHNIFQKRVSLIKNLIATRPKCIIDRKITGPWSKYTKIWRVLFENTHNEYLKDQTDFFLF